MDLPSFLWLWKIAAWSMGLLLSAYCLLAASGSWIMYARISQVVKPSWLRPLHLFLGFSLVGLTLLLLGVGIVGTLGHYGNLGHSAHLLAGFSVVGLVLASAVSASRISVERPWARTWHVITNLALLVGLTWVSWTGWAVVQKYLP